MNGRVVTVLLCVCVAVAAAVSMPHRRGSPPLATPPVELGQYELLNYNPVANPEAVVVQGLARFTVLTDRMIRMEYDPTTRFEDRATVAIVNRNLTVPVFEYYVSDGVATLRTAALELTYHVDQPFSPSTLSVAFLDGSHANWTYGTTNSDTRNLLGTVKSLDELDVIPLNCTENANIIVHDELLHCEWGLISRDGWALIDDSTNYALDSTYWWAGPTNDAVDLYILAHGHDYKRALREFVSVAGRIAMVPRYANGIWWSRWLNLNNYDVKQIVETYESYGLPLDVYILDMDWHTKEGWGGYSWDKRIFPYPADTMAYLASRGLHVGANIHDADGVRPNEDEHDAMAIAMGLNPSTCGTIPFSMVNSSYVYALEDVVLHAVEKTGMDFWWIDWQQGGQQGGCTGGKQNPTIWTDRIRCTDHLRRGENIRGLTLGRWGGLGTHRYQVGFSGDVSNLSWQDLAFQPYFSLTAANVGYGFWSHDFVGPWDDHEMHTRWIQWGSYSGTFRTHDRGMASGGCADSGTCAIVEMWKVPSTYFMPMRAALQTRAALLPYIYTATREAYDTGLSPLRPMYFEYPESEMAYAATASSFGQYFFGSADMFVAPVVVPVWSNISMAQTSVWVPPGLWIEKDTRQLHNGGTGTAGIVLTKPYDLTEIPVFIRAGAVIAESPVRTGDTIGRAVRQYDALAFTVYYSSSVQSGSTVVYEDDGLTVNYVTGGSAASAWTKASYTATTNQLTFTVTSTGSFPERPKMRALQLNLVNSMPPTSVTVNGQAYTYSRFGGPKTYRYSGVDSVSIIEIGVQSTAGTTTVVVNTLPTGSGSVTSDELLAGVSGAIRHAILSKQNLDIVQQTPGCNSVSGGALDQLASAGEAMSYLAGADPATFLQTLQQFPASLAAAQAEIASLNSVNPVRLAYSQALLSSVYV